MPVDREEIIAFLERNGIRWQPVKLHNKKPLRFSDGTKPDPHEMRRMTHWHSGDEGKPVLTDEELQRRKDAYSDETSTIWVDTTEVNIIDVDRNVDRHLASYLPQAKSTGKRLPHAFVKKLDEPLAKSTVRMGEGSELLCGQPAIQAVSDYVLYPDRDWERTLGLQAEGRCTDDYDEFVQDLCSEYLKCYRTLRHICGACKNLGVEKQKLEAVMPTDSPYTLNSAWGGESSGRLGVATLKLYGRGSRVRDMTVFDEWRDAFELYFFKLTHNSNFGYERDDGGLTLYTKQGFIISWSHWGSKFVRQWCDGGEERRYDYVDYLPPPLRCPETVYNSWSPFWFEAHDPVMYTIDGSGSGTDVEIFERFIRILAGGPDDDSLGLLRGFLGQILVEPGKLPQKLPIIYSGVQGIGKTTFFEYVMSAVLGKGAFCTAKLNSLFNGFSTQRAETLLCLVDEATQEKTERYRDAIASHVTAKTVRQEAKFVKPYDVHNTSRMVIATNDNQLMSISENDRRYLVFQAERKTSQQEVRELIAATESTSRLLAFVSYLREHAMTAHDIAVASGPQNLALKSMRTSSRGKEIDRWLEDTMKNCFGDYPKQMWTKTEVQKSMQEWALSEPDSDQLKSKFELLRDCKIQLWRMLDTWSEHIYESRSRNNNYMGKIYFDWPAIWRLLNDE